MGGPKKANLAAEQSSYQNLTNSGQQLLGAGNSNIAKQQEYQQPLVNFLKGQMGSLSNRISANAAPIGQIAQGSQQARENILDTQPAGAARDFALAGLKRDQSAQTSGLLNSTYLAAFPTLANIGNADASTGLQQLGGGIRGLEGGAQGLGQINQRDAQTKQSTLGALGGLAGGIGGAATGGLFKKAFSSPGAVDPTGGFSPTYASNPLGGGLFGAGPSLPPSPTSFLPQWNQSGYITG